MTSDQELDVCMPWGGGEGYLGQFLLGNVPLASQSPYPIVVYSVADKIIDPILVTFGQIVIDPILVTFGQIVLMQADC